MSSILNNQNHNDITVTGDFDGGNPREPNRFIRQGDNRFIIIPFSEDGDANYKFRLDVNFHNKASAPQHIQLLIDWQDLQFNKLRNHVYIRNDNDENWVYRPMHVQGSTAAGDLLLLPGITSVSLSPRYSYRDYIGTVSQLPKETFFSKVIGKTPNDREIWAIEWNPCKSLPEARIVIVARIHPYETAGSYCMEGIIKYLCKLKAHNAPQRIKNKAVYLLPMANPDGVSLGLCKRSDVDGVDMSKSLNFNEPPLQYIKSWLDDIGPDIYIELHNWMLPDLDGIFYMNRIQVRQFLKRFPSQYRFGKVWRIFLKNYFFSTERLGLKKYCCDRFRSKTAVLEFSWKNRSIRDMQRLGVASLLSV